MKIFSAIIQLGNPNTVKNETYFPYSKENYWETSQETF